MVSTIEVCVIVQPFRLLANARSHLRYTKTHFPLTENVGRVILEEYFRGDIIVLRDFNFGYYDELLYAP